MHAVGFDGETAMLLGAAKYLAANRNTFNGTITFVFYASFDFNLGAIDLIENSFLQEFPMDHFYRLEMNSHLNVGEVAIAAGPVTATVAELLIVLTGIRGHSAVPNLAKNPIMAGAEIINSLGNIVASEIDPANPMVIGIDSFISGDTFLYIPETAELKGAVRFLNPEIENTLPKKIENLVKKIAESYGVQADLSYRLYCVPCINEQEAARFARKAARDILLNEAVFEKQPPVMMGSDFGYFLQEVSGALIAIGNGSGPHMLSSQFDFNDDVLPIGASLMANLAMKYLQE